MLEVSYTPADPLVIGLLLIIIAMLIGDRVERKARTHHPTAILIASIISFACLIGGLYNLGKALF